MIGPLRQRWFLAVVAERAVDPHGSFARAATRSPGWNAGHPFAHLDDPRAKLVAEELDWRLGVETVFLIDA